MLASVITSCRRYGHGKREYRRSTTTPSVAVPLACISFHLFYRCVWQLSLFGDTSSSVPFRVPSTRTPPSHYAVMSSNLRKVALGLTALSMCLSLAMLGTAGRSLHVYFSQKNTNDWFLPLWPSHFDTRELEMLVGTSAAVFVLNTVLAVALLVPAVCSLCNATSDMY